MLFNMIILKVERIMLRLLRNISTIHYPTVVQNGRKPESTFTYATAKVGVSKIAHWIEATDDVLDDCTRIAERINSELEKRIN